MRIPKIWKKHKSMLIQIYITVILVGVCIWGGFLPTDVTTQDATYIHTMDEGWTQLLDGNQVTLPSIQHYVPVDIGEPIVMNRVIDDGLAGQNLAFYAENQEIVVSVGEKVLYEMKCPDYLAHFGSVGRTWVDVHIPEELVGETLTLQLVSDFDLYHGVPARVYCIPDGSLLLAQMNFLWIRNLVALIVLGLAIITYLNMRLWKQQEMRHFLFSMGNVYLFVGLWLCAEVNIFGGWIKRTPLAAVLAMVFLRIIPITIYYFFTSMMTDTSWRTKLVQFLVWVNLLVPLGLQAIWGISLIDTLPLNVVVVVAAALIGLWEIGILLRKGRQRTGDERLCCATSVLLIASLGECHTYMNYQTNGQWLGNCLTAGCIIFAMIAHIHLVRHESDVEMERTRLELEHNALNKRPLNQQINAHFLYNTLNTISAYCKVDPQKADIAVRKMAQYMRSYTHLVGEEDYVPLEEELDLIETYMQIQNMRFDNNIAFTVDNRCGDVLLPPLALQPLMENAVNHGIQNRLHSGVIRITAHEHHHMAEITVSDNGVGFDTAHHSGGVGLRNLNARIVAMGGSMTVRSTPNVGTAVTLHIPLLYDDSDIMVPIE